MSDNDIFVDDDAPQSNKKDHQGRLAVETERHLSIRLPMQTSRSTLLRALLRVRRMKIRAKTVSHLIVSQRNLQLRPNRHHNPS